MVDEMVEKHSNSLWGLLEEQLVCIITPSDSFNGWFCAHIGGNSPNTDDRFAGVVIFKLPSGASSWKEINPKVKEKQVFEG